MVVADIPQLFPAPPDQLRAGKERQLARLRWLLAEFGPTGKDLLNDKAMRLVGVELVSTLVALRRLG